jgi:hypothetical protein
MDCPTFLIGFARFNVHPLSADRADEDYKSVWRCHKFSSLRRALKPSDCDDVVAVLMVGRMIPRDRYHVNHTNGHDLWFGRVPFCMGYWYSGNDCVKLSAMAERNFVFLRYEGKIPAMAGCAKCQHKFFTPAIFWRCR